MQWDVAALVGSSIGFGFRASFPPTRALAFPNQLVKKKDENKHTDVCKDANIEHNLPPFPLRTRSPSKNSFILEATFWFCGLFVVLAYSLTTCRSAKRRRNPRKLSGIRPPRPTRYYANLLPISPTIGEAWGLYLPKSYGAHSPIFQDGRCEGHAFEGEGRKRRRDRADLSETGGCRADDRGGADGEGKGRVPSVGGGRLFSSFFLEKSRPFEDFLKPACSAGFTSNSRVSASGLTGR